MRGVIALMVSLVVSAAAQVRTDVGWDSDLGFYPDVVVISPGDTVRWVNVDSYGFPVQVVSDAPFGSPGYFSFYLVDFGDSTDVTFNTQGTFGYHSSFEDQGYVVVNIPPLVAITNPPDNAVFSAPATFTVEASASDTADDMVVAVEFLLGTSDSTNSLGADLSAPYSAAVTELAAGSYRLIAVATDSYLAQATNSITITVGSGAVISLNTPRVAGNRFVFEVTGLSVGKTNILQTSTYLSSWSGIRTNVASASSTSVTNITGPGPHFYRVIQLP